MGLSEVLAELPALTVAERQQLIRSAIELDDDELSQDEQSLVNARMANHRADPTSAIGLEEMKAGLPSRFDS